MPVFVVQQQMKFDSEKKILVPRFDSVEKASRFGELVYLLPPSLNYYRPEEYIGTLHQKLLDFNDSDFMLLIGSPNLIGSAIAIAAYYNDGSVNVLQWSGRHEDYKQISMKIF